MISSNIISSVQSSISDAAVKIQNAFLNASTSATFISEKSASFSIASSMNDEYHDENSVSQLNPILITQSVFFLQSPTLSSYSCPSGQLYHIGSHFAYSLISSVITVLKSKMDVRYSSSDHPSNLYHTAERIHGFITLFHLSKNC